MGARGPAGKRDAERRRRNTPEVETITVDLSETLKGEVVIPAPNEKWGELATEFYLSLTESGQAIFYEPSDWMVGMIVASQIDLEMKPRPVQTGTDDEGNPEYQVQVVPMPGAKLNAILKGMTMLMATEGDRRRLSIEVNRAGAGEATPAGVTNIEEKRRGHLA